MSLDKINAMRSRPLQKITLRIIYAINLAGGVLTREDSEISFMQKLRISLQMSFFLGCTPRGSTRLLRRVFETAVEKVLRRVLGAALVQSLHAGAAGDEGWDLHCQT